MSNPCHEKWEDMTESAKGKFCANCQTEVIDFTQMSNNEIIAYFKNNNIQKGCGRFYKKQLDTIQIPVDKQIFSYDLKSWQKFLVVVLFCFGQELFQVQLVFAQETNGDSLVISEVVESTFVALDSIEVFNEIDSILSPIEIKKKKVKESEFKILSYMGDFIVGSIMPINGGFGVVDSRNLPKCLKPEESFSPEIVQQKNEQLTFDNHSTLQDRKSNKQKEENNKRENQSMILPSLITFRKTRRKKK